MKQDPTAPTREIKIAYIGGGSRGWAHQLIKDLAVCPELRGQLALYDLNHTAALANVAVAEAVFSHRDARTKFTATAPRTVSAALKGADFVIMSIEPGPITMRYADLEIPAKFGIVQSVGDTTGPGGLLRALRSIPVYFEYGLQIRQHCPQAWVINYTNPMTLCTAALYAANPDIKAFGCCHEVFGTQWHLANFVERWLHVPQPPRQEIILDINGVNHFTFATAAHWQGVDLFPYLHKEISQPGFFRDRTRDALKRKRTGQWFSAQKLIALDLLARFGALGAAGDRHLAEFVPWYLTSEAGLHRWGEVLTPYSYRVQRDRQSKARFKLPEKLENSNEESIQLLLAILGLRALDTNVNLPNRGQNPDVALGAVTESYAQFRRDSVKPVVSAPLPPVLANHLRRIVENQQAVLQAALAADKDLAFQALLNDPLMRLPTDQAWTMFNQMLRFTKSMLPGWKI